MRTWLNVDIRSYWHAGTGRSGGLVVDAVCQRDRHGLPVLPGRHLKGLLRDALERAAAWDWPGHHEDLPACLFGDRSESGTARPKAGCLRISDARLPDAVSDWLAGDGRDRIGQLFSTLHVTAIDPDLGIARDRSLRGIEVAVPLELRAEVSLVPGSTIVDGAFARLQEVLPLVEAVGAWRHRGLGRAALSLAEVAS